MDIKKRHYYVKSNLQMLGRMANLLIKHQIEMSYNGGLTVDFVVIGVGEGVLDNIVWAEQLVSSFETLCKQKNMKFEVDSFDESDKEVWQ